MRKCIANSEKGLRGRAGRTRLAAAALALLFSIVAPQFGLAQNFTLANNVFPSTPVGESTTQSVTLTLNAALALESITIPAGFSDYSLGEISGCILDGATVNAAGTVCTLSVTYTPIAPGSTASPMLARTAPLLVTDIEAGNPVTYNFGLTGAATGPILALSAGTFTRYAGEADAAATDPGDNGLGVVNPGYAGDGGPANEAQLAFNVRTQNEEGSSPMAVDSAGNLYIADGGNYVIRRVDAATGNIALYAGEPGVAATDNYAGAGLQVVDGVLATQSPLAPPYGLMLDAAGNLYFLELYSTDYGGTGAVLREVNAATGIISTIAGSSIWYYPISPPYSGPGTCADSNHCGDGGPATAAFLAAPIAMTMDSAGNIYLYFPYGNIREINASTGIINTIATPSVGSENNAGYGITMGADGNLYVANYDPNPTSVSANAAEYLTQVNPSTGAIAIAGGDSPPTVAGCQQMGTPFSGWLLDFYAGGLTSDGAGNLYDFFNFGCNADLYEQQYETWMSLNSGLGYELYLYQGGYGDFGPGTIYNVVDGLYVFSYIPNTGAAPDNQGNFYMMSSYNQVAKLSTSAAALPEYPSRGDGTTSGTQTVVVWNMGNAGLTATISMPVDYVLSPAGDPDACTNPFELAAGQGCDLDISFSPASDGELDETATITDSNGQQAQLQLYGEGAGTPIPRGIFSPESYDFGSQPVNATTSPQAITFTNGGGATLSITGISITGANAVNFAQTNDCPSTLAAGAGCTINITFTPGAATSYAAMLSVADNTTLTPQTAALSGTGSTESASNLTIHETIQVSDAPVLAENTLLAIGETISVNDAGAGTTLTPSTLLAIAETIHTNDAGAGTTLNPSTLLPISETIQVADAASISTATEPSIIVWPAPAPIVYGTALSATQLDPTASTAGSFTFAPPAGTVLTAGTYTLTASFTPSDPSAWSSASATATLTVTPAPLTATANNATRAYGAANPPFSGTLTGAVNGDALTEQFTTLATPLSPPGSYLIVPLVTGTNVSSYAVTAPTGTLTVTKAASTATLTSSPTTLSEGDSVTFTATVASSTTGAPTGTMTFLSGTTTLGSASLIDGAASFTTTELEPGRDEITAVYAGDTDFNGSTSSPVPVNVSGFTLTVTSGTVTVLPGGTATVTLLVTPTNGAFGNPITFAATGLPPGATANFEPASVTPGGSAKDATLTIQTAGESAASAGPRGLRRGIAFGLLLPLFVLRRLRRAKRGSLRLVLLAVFAWAGAIAVSGCTRGGVIAPPPQSYSITITAASGPVNQSSTFTLTVE